MSSIVTSILSSTVGLLVNKVRDKTADSLRGGDVADVKIRQLIVRELSDVKTKLDGLSRKDLLSSYILLKQGVDLLNASLDKSKPKAVLGATKDDGGEIMPRDVQPDILNKALELSNAIGNLKIVSDSQFEAAIKRFEEARGRATDAFSNDALNIEDRLMAAKLHIVATILENLESPETAIVACLSFLKDLHGLQAVQETFLVYLYGGIKAIINKSERLENVKSVMLINYVLCHFVTKFSSNRSFVFSCPAIELDDDRCFHPILQWFEVSTRKFVGEELAQHPSEVILDRVITNTDLSVVTSHGEIVTRQIRDGSKLEVIGGKGKTKVDKLDAGECQTIMEAIAGLAVDNINNVYVVRWFIIFRRNVNTYSLNVLDENYNPKHNFALDFFNADIFTWVSVAISRNNNIIMTKQIANDPYVYVCKNTGELKYKFDRYASLPRSLSISRQNEIMITFEDGDAVYTYTEEGNLKTTIKLAEGHKASSVEFHYVICKIIILTYFEETSSYFLHCYSETGERETSKFLCTAENDKCSLRPRIKSHPSGLAAVVRNKIIIFI